jgi:chromosome segregation ATPase
MKPYLVILLVLSLGVSAVLFLREKEMAALMTTLEEEKSTMSKDVEALRTDLEQSQTQIGFALAKLEKELEAAQEQMKLARENIVQRDVHIAQLRNQREISATKLDELQIVLESLDVQINETRLKLATTEWDREFLKQQLRRLESEKADSLQRWNDPKALRAQYSKVKELASIGQRIDWLRNGAARIDRARGAELLVGRVPAPTLSDHALVGEIDASGAARILDRTPGGGLK